MSLGAEAWWWAMMAADQFQDGSLVIEDDTLDVTGGDTVNLRVKLGARPRSDVTVALSETSSLISLGDDELTFTPDNWDTYQTVVVTAGNRQTINLLSSWYQRIEFGTTLPKLWAPPMNSRPVIIGGLAGGNTRTFQSFALGNSGIVTLHISAGQTGTAVGEDLSSLFETSGSIRLEAEGEALELSMAGRDVDEPYVINPTPQEAAVVSAIYGSLSTVDGSETGTLTLRDYVPGDATISLSASGPDEYANVTGSATVSVN